MTKEGGDFSCSESTTVPRSYDVSIVSDHGSGSNENKKGNIIIDKRAKNMSAYLEGD